ncbi:septum formation initiator family protein [Desulfovibrio sp. OttesenSCG-928-F20]|nr:septum formation initiator family protein [Desulfovibrio sp. OttesenSCG-928-M16]MDL2290578.1 septum formation initiator family protein [Desulfovibrio sp. OttesenSCG-928-F20]
MFVRRAVLGLAIVLNLVLLYNLIWGKSGAIAYTELKSRCLDLEARILAVKEENLELSREIRLLQSDEKYLEKTIRNRLNFVRSNEILYIFPGENAGGSQGAQSHETKN